MSTNQLAALAYTGLLVLYAAVSVVHWVRFHGDPAGYARMMRRSYPTTSDGYTDESYMLEAQRLPIRILILSAAVVFSFVVFVLPLT